MKESQIRDLLITQLNIFSDDYTFLEKEKYIPSNIGTRSFIDLLAKDNKGKYIIIEIKKSKASSREAIHELLKYVTALKENKGLKDDELKLVIVSTVWDELIIPFSTFVVKANLDIEGFKLILQQDNEKLLAEKIKPINIVEDRLLSAVQMARYYKSITSLNKGIKAHERHFDSIGVENFVLLILTAPENYADFVVDSLNKFYEDIRKNKEFENMEIPKDINPESFNYKYMIYSTNQIQDIDTLKLILDKNCEYPEIVTDIIEDDNFTNIDKLERLNEQLINCGSFPDSDYVEIGTPAKFEKFINIENWNIESILRYGKLKQNELLTDETILNEIGGSSGTTGEKYESIIDFSSKSNIDRVKKEINNCLSNNEVWNHHILHIIDILSKEEEIVDCHCSIYNPMNIIYSIYLISTRPDGLLFIPSYTIRVKTKQEERIYIGYLGSSGNTEVKLKQVFEKFYDNSTIAFDLSLTWGGYDKNNLDICRYIGLEYYSMLCTISNDLRTFYKYENYSFLPTEPFMPINKTLEFINSNNQLTTNILEYFEDHLISGGIFIS